MLFTVLIIVLVIALLGGLPSVGVLGAGVGYGPSEVLGIILIIVVLWVLFGRNRGGPVL